MKINQSYFTKNNECRRDDPEDNIEHNQLDFIQQEYDQQNDEQSINFRPTAEVKKDEEENF